jgi:multicopper oxidase
MHLATSDLTRREILGAAAALPLTWSTSTLLAQDSPASGAQPAPRPPTQTKPDYTFNLAAKTIAPVGNPIEVTLVNGTLPGTEIRYLEGDMFRVLVNNRLNVPATVHWHGMIVPNYMDGVPDVTQYPIAPGESVLYEYPLRQTGTYWYHSHYQFQEQTGLSGPLIVEARNELHKYDHDVVVFMSDWLDQPPESVVPQLRMQQPPTAATKMTKPGGYTFPGDNPFEVDINYPGYLINGKPATDPWMLRVKRGDRVRLRLINGSAATFFRVTLDAHELQVIAADGQPVEPITVSDVVVGAAERYDALVTIGESGNFTLHAAALGTNLQALGVIYTDGSTPKPNTAKPTFTGKSGGMADYAALQAPFATMLPDGPVRQFDVALGGMMKKYLWTMGGKLYPEMFSPEGDAEPLTIKSGERVRIRFTNTTMMYHPMHLHGHFFRLLPQAGAWDAPNAPLKDSVAVGPMQKIDIEFFADNPGKWFFHCHNLYHMAAGMARVVQYEV